MSLCPRCNAIPVKVSEKDGTVVAACFYCDIKWTVKRISLTPMALAALGLTAMLALPPHKEAIQPEIDVEIPAQPSQLSYELTVSTATVVMGTVGRFGTDRNFL